MGSLLSLSKSATVAALHVSEWGLLLFGLIVAVGIVGEIKLPPWHHRLKLFEILVLIGVAGEMAADGGVFLFSSRLESIDDSELIALGAQANTLERRLGAVRDKANDASKLADSVGHRSDQLGLTVSEVEQRADRLSRTLDSIDARVTAQGPRWELLEGTFARTAEAKLKAFRGQLAFVVACENNPYTSEHEQTIGDVFSILHNAEWNVSPPPTFRRCIGVSTNGLMVYVHERANADTIRAADALGDLLLPRINSLPLFRKTLHEDFKLLKMPDGSVMAPPPWTMPMLAEHFRDAVLISIPRHP